ncbi:hypothetical protein B4113_2918 [Geobacillus sp. B4113_201601]|nr:hypothetical protein B4113_2918 [Geobacillus sp. B4113_201601]
MTVNRRRRQRKKGLSDQSLIMKQVEKTIRSLHLLFYFSILI